jgi:phosphatidate cytidylyltransferase
MLWHRVVTSLILLALTLVVFFLVPEPMFIVIAILLSSIGVYELSRMYNFDITNQIGLVVVYILFTSMLCFIHYDVSQFVRFTSILLWCFVVPVILILQPKNFSKGIISILAIVTFSAGVYTLTVLHVLLGAWQLLSIMSIAWIADIGAYFMGRKFGKHKLAKAISPGKSVEGALCGLVFVIIYLLILKYLNWAIYLPDYATVFKFGITLVAVSVLGDLFESWLKRVAGVKDSGTVLPGHGGVFDRVDSLVAVLAIAFALIRGYL